MCTNEPTSTAGAAQLDVAALLLAAPGLEVMAALTALDLAALSESDRLIVLEVWERQQHWVWAQTMTATLAFAGQQPIDSDDFVREDVRAALRLSRPAAQDRIDTARLLASPLTDTSQALAGGAVSPGQVRRLVEEVKYLAPEVAVAVQDRVLPKAQQQTVSEFGRAVKKAILVVDPQTAEEQHASAMQTRTVQMYPEPDAMATISTVQPAHQAVTIMQALNAIASAAKAADPDPGRCTMDQRRADALYTLCAAALADPTLPKRHGRPPGIQVVIDLPTLLGLAEHPGQLAGYGPIPASIARMLAASGVWQRLVVEPVTGHLLDLGSTRYRPSQELTDYLLARDPECTFPVCPTPAHACDIDHNHPFNHHPDTNTEGGGGGGGSGGSTSSDNNNPKCGRHHQLKTHGGWTTRRNPDGTTTWTNTHGRRYHCPPRDHRPDTS